MEKRFHLQYRIGSVTFTSDFLSSFENNHLRANVSDNPRATSLLLVPKTPLVIEALSCEYDCDFAGADVYLNGYQSWTDSRELCARDRMPGLCTRPKAFVKKYALNGYGDYDFTEYRNRRGFFHGFTYAYIRRADQLELIGSLSERSGFTVLYFDLPHGRVRIEKDCRGLALSEPYKAFDLVRLCGSEDAVFDAYFAQMHIAKPAGKKILGYTSWYNYYQNISEGALCENLDALAQSGIHYDVFQIDDGFEQYVGDWLRVDSAKFPHGLAPIAQKIRDGGMTAGIWLAPFVCELKSDVYREHPDWIVRREDGSPFLCGNNWSFFAPLDFYNPQVKAYIREVFAHYREMGFSFFKLDFLYGVCALPRSDKTRGQICCEAMEFLRECAGDKLLLGCGAPLAPCFGVFDYMRIGCDVSLDWDNTPVMRLLHRERTGTKPALLNTVYRRQLDGRAFCSDPDVFLLREGIRLNGQQKEILLLLNALFGSVLFTSDNIGTYTGAQRALFEQALRLQQAKDVRVEGRGQQVTITYTLDAARHGLQVDLKNGVILSRT